MKFSRGGKTCGERDRKEERRDRQTHSSINKLSAVGSNFEKESDFEKEAPRFPGGKSCRTKVLFPFILSATIEIP